MAHLYNKESQSLRRDMRSRFIEAGEGRERAKEKREVEGKGEGERYREGEGEDEKEGEGKKEGEERGRGKERRRGRGKGKRRGRGRGKRRGRGKPWKDPESPLSFAPTSLGVLAVLAALGLQEVICVLFLLESFLAPPLSKPSPGGQRPGAPLSPQRPG